MAKVVPFPKKKDSKAELDKILEDMDPEKINKEVEMKHRDARNKYDLKHHKMPDGADPYEFVLNETIAYLQHHHKQVYKSELPDHMVSGQARELLERVFEKKGGIAGAQREAKAGRMDRVLNAIADELEDIERRQYVNHVFNQVDPHDFDTHVRIVDQYKSKYGDLLPEGLKQKSSEELAHMYNQLIDHHIKVVQESKSILKKYEHKRKSEEKAA